jgi:hypothetical protein
MAVQPVVVGHAVVQFPESHRDCKALHKKPRYEQSSPPKLGVHHVEKGKASSPRGLIKKKRSLEESFLKTKDTNKENSLELHFRWM